MNRDLPGPDDVRRLAALARLALDDDDLPRLTDELARVGGAIVAALDTPSPERAPDVAAPRPPEPRWRDDRPQESGLADRILAQVPARRGRWVRVPSPFER
ncbi:MAG: hypothetical protein Kow0062_06190 [Acidobacteriota bacterium]|nr:MAG: hypothetical protein D6738_10360 [Acidobacteriota bacterium]